jgi:hypothetical protein
VFSQAILHTTDNVGTAHLLGALLLLVLPLACLIPTGHPVRRESPERAEPQQLPLVRVRPPAKDPRLVTSQGRPPASRR